jgi:hypothetical protein
METTLYRSNTVNIFDNSLNSFLRENKSKSESLSTRVNSNSSFLSTNIEPSISTIYHWINFYNKINNQQIYTNKLLDNSKFTTNSSTYLGEIYNELIIENPSLILSILLDKIYKKYIVDNQEEVSDFLYKHQELFLIVLEAEKKIKQYFLNDKLSLKIITDPEIANWENLIIIIQTKLDVDQAFDKLKQLDNDWWLDVFYLVGNKLNIHIDFDEI